MINFQFSFYLKHWYSLSLLPPWCNLPLTFERPYSVFFLPHWLPSLFSLPTFLFFFWEIIDITPCLLNVQELLCLVLGPLSSLPQWSHPVSWLLSAFFMAVAPKWRWWEMIIFSYILKITPDLFPGFQFCPAAHLASLLEYLRWEPQSAQWLLTAHIFPIQVDYHAVPSVASLSHTFYSVC